MQVSSKTDRLKDLDFSTRLLGSDASRSNTGFDQDNPSPQSGKDLPLKDLTVYPEVFSNETNISETTHGYLEKLGAKIEKRINKKCNVIIWKDGSIKTLEKAREYGIPVVSLLWLEDCTDHFHRADFAKYTKSLPTETEMPFLALQETKKRKSFDIPEDEDPFLGGIPQDLLKPTLKKKKKNTSDDEDKKGDKFSLRFDDDSKKKNLRRSQTTKPAPSAGSWLLTINDSDKKESSFGSSRNKAEKTQKTEKPLKNSSNDEWQGSSNLNIESIFQKKKTEEDSAKVRSMIFKYARSGSLGGDDSFDVNDTSYNKENDDKDESNKSYSLDESREDEKRDRWASKFDDESSNSKSKSFMSRSMSLGEKSYSSLLEDEPKTFGFRTRVMLREERQNFENERQKEKRAGEDSTGKQDNSFDIGIRAREELFKKEGANFGKISEIWSKYTGKADPKAKESKEKEDQKNKMEEEPMANSRNLKKDKISSLDKGRELPDRRVSARKTVEKKSSTGSDSEEDIVVQRKGKESLSKKLINYNKDEDTPRKTDDKKVTPAQLSKSVKLETPTRKTTTSTVELEKTQDTRYSSEIKTPQTKQPYSLSKSSLIGKYLGSASSNNDYSPSPFASSVENGSSAKKKETEDSESYLSGLRNNGVRNLIAGLEPSKTKKKSSFEEEKEESEEEEFMTKTIKKRTDDKKKEDLVLFSGISGKSLAKAQEFCKKFNFKLIEDELRNLSRADFLVYEGNEIPKNYRVAFTMMRGKPIVNLDWVEESVKNGKLSNYKEHEFCYSPEGRKKLLAGLRFYIDKEFEGQTGNMVLKKDMVNLLEQSNGKIFDNVRSCDFCVMKKMGKKSSDIPAHVKIITPQWIIDSIIEGKLLSTDAINYNF